MNCRTTWFAAAVLLSARSPPHRPALGGIIGEGNSLRREGPAVIEDRAGSSQAEPGNEKARRQNTNRGNPSSKIVDAEMDRS